MSTQTRPRAPRTQAAIKASQVDAKAQATLEASAVKVEAQEAATEAAVTPREASLGERQNRLVNDYRNAESRHGSSQHAAKVAAIAFFRTLPDVVNVATAKSSTQKPVSVRERASQTLEALCVKVERDSKGKAVRGLDTIGFTVNRFSQLVDAFNNAEATGLVKVDALADASETDAAGSDAEQVEALVSALDQAAVVGGKRAAEALASSVREQVQETVEAEGAEAGSPLSVAVEIAQSDVKDMRAAKVAQAKVTPVVKTAAQTIGDAVQGLWDALESEARNLDAGQKSAILAKVQELSKFLK